MYAPYRALGQVCDGAQGGGASPTLHRRGAASFLTTPVAGGRALHLYDTSLRLKGVSPPLPAGATARVLAAVDDYTFVATADGVVVLRSMRLAATWGAGEGEATALLVVGGSFLVAVFGKERRVIVWRVPTSRKAATPKKGDVVANVALPDGFEATAVAHPPTYLNKILLGASDGRLVLLNIRTQKVVHVFPGFKSRVTVLAPSPVLDVVAVGTADGRIILHNIRVDESVCTLRHGSDLSLDHEEDSADAPRVVADSEPDSSGEEDHDVEMDEAGKEEGKTTAPPTASVSVVSFCTDGSETVVTGDAVGNLAVWNLNDQAVTAVARGVHAGGTSFAEFLPGESLLITVGLTDNAVKVHAFDGPTRTARVLRAREGHRLPPTRVRFSGRDARMLVSAGLDREVRIVSAVRDAQNRSFSQAGLARDSTRVRKRRRATAGVEAGAAQQMAEGARRLPVVTGIATSSARRRDKDFANVVTIHSGRREAYTWRVESGAVYQHVLRPPRPPHPLKLAFQRGQAGKACKSSVKNDALPSDGTAADKRHARAKASAVVMSHCGNFALLGLSNGEVHSFNLQSGRHLGTFVADPAYRALLTRPTQNLRSWGRAHNSAITGLAVDACGDVLITGGGDSLRFWNMRTREPIGDPVALPAGITSLVWSKASDLIAAVCEDFGVYVYDAGTRKLARRLVGHTGAVTDVAFDSEGRRVVTSSMDGSIKTWDLPSGRAVDTLRCETAPTSIAVGPGGEFIASCHVNSLSVALWVDRSKFGGAHRKWTLEANDSDDDGNSGDESGSDRESSMTDVAANGVHDKPTDQSAVVSSLASDLITLSGRPTTQWTTLANLDAIKQRNKPLQPPKKPEHVPFFLPTVKGIKPKFDVEAAEKAANSDAEETNGDTESKPLFGGDDDFFGNSEFGSLVAAGNTAAASKLLAGMGPSGVDMELRTLEGAQSRLGAAQYFVEKLKSRRDFEINQAQLDVFLKAHGRELAGDESGTEVLADLAQAQNESWTVLRNAFDSVLTLSSHFAGHV